MMMLKKLKLCTVPSKQEPMDLEKPESNEEGITGTEIFQMSKDFSRRRNLLNCRGKVFT
jgi:hypothetical protein